MTDEISRFIDEVDQSISSAAFVKLTLSNYKGTELHLQKLFARPVETKRGHRILFLYRYATRDVTKNFDRDGAVALIRELLTSGFRSAHLFTTSQDFQLTIGKRNSRLVTGPPTFQEQANRSHNREKSYLIDPSAYYLKSLGITTESGEVRARQQDKWRQINKYVEILRDLYERSDLKTRTELKIVDMGSGKGYLTFAAYDYFANVLGLKVEMTGVEARDDLVDLCNEIARSGGFRGLKFVSGTIANSDATGADILIALHACDTATDDALYKGISSGAEIIVAAPCCHKEVRQQLSPPELLKGILKHGTMLEREAETITDGLRAMLLERSGYSARVFEFVSPEHTPKNNMIVATRARGTKPDAHSLQEQIDAVKAFYGIEKQRLENLLA